MRKLLWPARIGLVTLALVFMPLVFMPAEAGEGRLSGASLCAAETGDCEREYGSFCTVNGEVVPDATPKDSE